MAVDCRLGHGNSDDFLVRTIIAIRAAGFSGVYISSGRVWSHHPTVY